MKSTDLVNWLQVTVMSRVGLHIVPVADYTITTLLSQDVGANQVMDYVGSSDVSGRDQVGTTVGTRCNLGFDIGLVNLRKLSGVLLMIELLDLQVGVHQVVVLLVQILVLNDKLTDKLSTRVLLFHYRSKLIKLCIKLV